MRCSLATVEIGLDRTSRRILNDYQSNYLNEITLIAIFELKIK